MIVELDGYSKYINQQNGCEFIFDTEDTDVVSKETWNYRKSRNSIEGYTTGHTIGHAIGLKYGYAKKVLRKNNKALDYRKSNLWFGNAYKHYDDRIVCTCFGNNIIIISPEDFDLVKDYVWHVDANGYAITKTKEGRVIKQHRLILNILGDDTLEVDHINHNKIDNRRENLRTVDRSLNCLNRRAPKTNTSGYAGIYWHKSANKWAVQTRINKKTDTMFFNDKESAILYRKNKENELSVSTQW